MEEDKKGQATKGGDDAGKKKAPSKAEVADSSVAQAGDGAPATTAQKDSVPSSKARTEPKDASASGQPKPPKMANKLREFRIDRMMSKAELARKAGLSVLTVARIEKGYGCRMDTKRKILKALGLKLSDRRKVFEDE